MQLKNSSGHDFHCGYNERLLRRRCFEEGFSWAGEEDVVMVVFQKGS